MAMHLLKKSEITTAQAVDRNREVQEGLKLSRKVDGLRELMQKEEATLEKFRVETLANIARETSEANAKKESLLKEVQLLREEKDKGLKEVEDKNTELGSLSIKLNEFEQKLSTERQQLDEQHIKVAVTLKNSQDELQRAKTHKDQMENLHQEADLKAEEARKTLNQARQELADSLAVKAKTEQFVLEANKNLDDKRKELRAKEEELNKKEIDLTTLSVQLNDRSATIKRNIKRKNG